MLLNFIYELTSFKSCTSIVFRTETGRIVHGRNLDFFFWNFFADISFIVEMYKGDEHIFTGDGIGGAVFFHTGIKPGKFAISQDTRHGGSFADLFKAAFIDGYIPSMYLIRKVLQEEDNFANALHRLNTTNIAAPIYYIVSGLSGNEGVVIEREREGIHGFY